MKRRYLKKINATYRFKIRVLNLPEFKNLSEEQYDDLWRFFLQGLYKSGEISKHQSKTWTYPHKELNS